MTPGLAERLVQNLEQLRVLLKEYRLSTPTEQTAVRATIYQKHGGIGKHVVKATFDEIAKLEEQYAQKYKSIAELNSES